MSKLEINNIVASSGLNLTSPTVPSSATDTGAAGDISWDSSYIYVCTATNTWKRTAALSSWSSLPDIAGLQLWLDADDSDTITLNGSTVSQWNDKSGNDYHVSQGTASNQPTYTASALNGKSVVRFDGGDELLNGSATPVGGDTNRTIFIVFNATVTGTKYALNLGDSTANGAAFACSREIAVRMNNGGRIYANDPVNSSHAIVTFMLDGTNATDLSAWNNGSIATYTAQTARTVNTAAGINVGNGPSGGNLTGDVAEIIVYNSALSTSDRESVQSYLSSKWGITVS